jgi:hypothetical protein
MRPLLGALALARVRLRSAQQHTGSEPTLVNAGYWPMTAIASAAARALKRPRIATPVPLGLGQLSDLYRAASLVHWIAC